MHRIAVMDYIKMSATVLPEEPYLSVTLAFVSVAALVAVVFTAYLCGYKSFLALLPKPLADYLRFAYSCFIKPHDAKAGRDQKAALESFYSSQASVYDRTRARLLQGRDDMLALVAAQVKHRIKDGRMIHKPIWVDVSRALIANA
jgi:betaine lipid synthase